MSGDEVFIFICMIIICTVLLSVFSTKSIVNEAWWTYLQDNGYSEVILVDDVATNRMIAISELAPLIPKPKLPPGDWKYITEDGQEFVIKSSGFTPKGEWKEEPES